MSPRRILQWRVAAVCALASLLPVPMHAQHPSWMDPASAPAQRAARLLGAMTLDEKMAQLVGAPGIVPELPQCYGARHVPGIAHLGIPTLRVTNGPVGIGQNDCVPPATPGLPMSALGSRLSARATALPSGISVAASFDTAVATRFGDVIGVEARELALHVLEGPGVNLARVPQGGRNFEYFGEDPFLTGTMGVSEIRAIQHHGVIAMAKHFVANEQETNRFTVDETVADRVLHELYLLPFEMAVKEGNVASIMCSYNAVNGPHACQDAHHLTDVLRGQWGFQGYVQSDFFAVHSTAPALRAGMDHEMPGLVIGRPGAVMSGPWYTPENLRAALDRHEIAVADIDTALARRYRQMFRLGIFDRPVAETPIDTARDAAVARTIGESGAVLLQNRGNLLPLDAHTVRSVALIGQATYAAHAVAGCCGGSSDVIPLRTVAPLDGVRRALAALGATATTTLTIVADDGSNRAEAVAAARRADVAVVLAGTIADEGRDRASIALSDGQDSTIAAVAAANPRTVVVLKDNASSLLPWADRVPAVLETWFPGQEDGDIVARLLFGLATPSGKLPVTFPRLESDLPASTASRWPGVDSAGAPVTVARNGGVPTRVAYSEGLDIGYRWFDARDIAPRFPFGHGLSYTTFRISGVHVTPRRSNGRRPIEVRLLVQNTGRRRGAEVPQLYVGVPAAGEPPRRLVAFTKVWLAPGERRQVRLVIDPRAASHPLGIWDEAAQRWKIPNGAFPLAVGTSSRDIVFRDTLTLRGSR